MSQLKLKAQVFRYIEILGRSCYLECKCKTNRLSFNLFSMRRVRPLRICQRKWKGCLIDKPEFRLHVLPYPENVCSRNCSNITRDNATQCNAMHCALFNSCFLPPCTAMAGLDQMVGETQDHIGRKFGGWYLHVVVRVCEQPVQNAGSRSSGRAWRFVWCLWPAAGGHWQDAHVFGQHELGPIYIENLVHFWSFCGLSKAGLRAYMANTWAYVLWIALLVSLLHTFPKVDVFRVELCVKILWGAFRPR